MKSLCDMKAESPKPKTREEELQEYCENLEERIEQLELGLLRLEIDIHKHPRK